MQKLYKGMSSTRPYILLVNAYAQEHNYTETESWVVK